MLHTTASSAVLQQLSRSALRSGIAGRIGLECPRLEVAAGSLDGAAHLSAREVAALAYGHGLSVEATATLAYGGGLPADLFRQGAQASRLEKLQAAPAWWCEPTAHMRDLGDGATRRLIGALLGFDLVSAPEEAPLPVPVDARFAAATQMELGDHWSLGVGVRDGDWIQGLNRAARDLAPKVMPLLSASEIEEAEEEREAYHLSYTSPLRPHQAVRRYGAGVSMVFSDSRMGWWSVFLRVKSDRLVLSVSLLDQRWIEARGYHGPSIFMGSSFGEVACQLYEFVPGSEAWTLAALRSPAAAQGGVVVQAPAAAALPAALRWA